MTSRWSLPAYAALVFLLNVYICNSLFGAEFIHQMGSVEGSHITLSRWILENWGDLAWFPLWFNGMPLHTAYQPGLPFTVAGVAAAFGWTPQHAYHFTVASAYTAGALTLFWLCYSATKDRTWALLTSLLFSLLSPACLLAPNVRADGGGWFSPRRFQVLTQYGEGPHIAALALIPVAILLLHGRFQGRRVCAALAPFALAAVALTNWPAAMGLAMAVTAYCLAWAGTGSGRAWRSLLWTAVAAYFLASPWIPPSVVAAVFSNAPLSDGAPSQLWLPAVVLVALSVALFLWFRRSSVDRWVRFFALFTLFTAAVSMGGEWFGWHLTPQPSRFQTEFEMALAGLVGYALARVFRAIPPRLRPMVAVAAAAAALLQTNHYADRARSHTQPIDITETIEYRMAKWFEANLADQRVFAPGSVSLWMNLFTDTPQMVGCCDQGIPHIADRIAFYTIYTGQNAGARDAQVSLLWLRAFGVGAIGVTGPGSTEITHAFANWEKFDGVLPELWRDGDDAIFRVPRKSPWPVRVIPKRAIVPRTPDHGLATEALEPFVAALEDPTLPEASWKWINRHQVRIDAATQPGQVVYIQASYDPGWTATQNGEPLPAHSDPLGLMYVEPTGSGPVHLELTYTAPHWTRMLVAFGLAMVAWLTRRKET
jgi:hypothetical protein